MVAVLAAAIALPQATGPARATDVPGAVTWTVDHQAKTITAKVLLQIYPGCSGGGNGTAEQKARACRGVTSQVTDFIAKKIKAQAEGVWNRGYFYRCYLFVLEVEVQLATGPEGVKPGRIGVMIDPSFAGIRDTVGDSDYDPDDWDSNDPSAAVDPDQEGSVWGEQSQYEAATYAHEIGHILGLDDHYHTEKDPTTGDSFTVPNEGADIDLMSTGATEIAQSTIDRVVERNRNNLRDRARNTVTLDDLDCPEFMATLDGKQTDHKGTKLTFDGCVGTSTLSRSDDQTVAFISEKAHVDAAKLVQAHALWPGLEVLLVPHGKPAASIGLNAGPLDAPTLFTIPATFSVDRANALPGVGPMPSVVHVGTVPCAGGTPGGGQPQDDCGHREYQAQIAVTLTGVTILLPQFETGTPEPSSLYQNCQGPTPIPGLFAFTGGATISGGSVPVAKLLDPTVDKIDITGSATFTIVEPGRYETIQYDWLLQLCRIRHGVPAC